ncbi:MAG: hypothetical protein ACRD1I_05320 [Terriglobia bacterium]
MRGFEGGDETPPGGKDASEGKQKGKQSAPADGSKTDGMGGRNGGKRGLKNQKGLFYFFQVIENKESEPERTGTNRTLMIVKSLQSTEYEGDSRIDPVQ